MPRKAAADRPKEGPAGPAGGLTRAGIDEDWRRNPTET